MTTLTRNTDQLKTEVAEHVAQDRIIQGTYAAFTEDGFRGCFIGCLGHSADPVVAAERFGLTEPLLRIAEHIFESLPADLARQFFADFPAAVGTDGKDLSLIHWQFLASEFQALIDPVIAGMELLANGQNWPAARAGVEAAVAAARAARAGVEAAVAARALVILRQRDLFLELVRNAPVMENAQCTTPDFPDFRALCVELVEELEVWIAYGDEADCADAHVVVDRARAALAAPPPEPPTSCITLHAPPAPEEIIRIDKEGFHYKGQFVADAGEAHRLMVAFLKHNNKVEPDPPTDEEIAAAIQKGADQEFYATVKALAEYCDCGVELTGGGAREVLYELRRPHIVLDYWGNEKHEGAVLERWGNA